MLLWYALAAGLTLAVALLIYRFVGQRAATSEGVDVDHEATQRISASSGASAIPFRNEAIVSAQNSIYKLSFGVTRFDYEILGDHLSVLKSIEEALAGAVTESRYFPRKPALLPKLLRAINTSSSGRGEIVRLILQDAVLAGNVLKRANSAYYNHGNDVIESVDRAVAILGNEGLRAPVASAVMQPVFQLPAGFFEHFAPITWEQARRTAVAAEEFARVRRSADAFVAHLVGMLDGLGRIVLFRLTMDKYKARSNMMPRAEVFIRAMTDHSQQVARSIAAAWEMSPQFLEALDAQISRTPPDRMTPLAQTLYYANLCGTFSTLCAHNVFTVEQAKELLVAQGLKEETFDSIWRVATTDESVGN